MVDMFLMSYADGDLSPKNVPEEKVANHVPEDKNKRAVGTLAVDFQPRSKVFQAGNPSAAMDVSAPKTDEHDSGSESDDSTSSRDSAGITSMGLMQDHDFDGDPETNITNPFGNHPSNAETQWARQRRFGEENTQIDELMKFKGLEEIKQQFLDIKYKADISRQQGRSSKDKYHVVFQGSPGQVSYCTHFNLLGQP